MHYNPHKTFSGPHGGGGPGAGPDRRPRAPGPVPARAARRPRRRRHVSARPRPAASRSAGSGRSSATPASCSAPTATSAARGPTASSASPQHAVLNANYLMSLVKDVYPVPYGEPLHARVRRLGPVAGHGPGHPGDGHRQAADRLQLPRADGLFPADRPRGADDRADRDREPRDARSVRQGAPARSPRKTRSSSTTPRTRRRSAGPTRSRPPRRRSSSGSRPEGEAKSGRNRSVLVPRLPPGTRGGFGHRAELFPGDHLDAHFLDLGGDRGVRKDPAVAVSVGGAVR